MASAAGMTNGSWTSFAALGGKQSGALEQMKTQLGDLQEKVKNADPKSREAAQKFEAFYIQQFLQMSAPDVDTSGMFYGGMGEEMFKDKMYEHIADTVAKQGGFGLADKVLGQIIQRQEAEAAARAATTPAAAAGAYTAAEQ